jgi:uncharacterized protein YkwD
MPLRWPVTLVLLLGIATTPAAAETFRLGYGEARRARGVTVRVEVRDHAHREDGGADGEFALVVTRGKKKAEQVVWAETPALEVVAFGAHVVARGGINDVEITVKKAGKVKKGTISDDAAVALVEKEAARRGIATDGTGAFSQGGLVLVSLMDRGRWIVQAAVGQRSRKLLWFDVDPYAQIAAKKRKAAASAAIRQGGSVKLKGLTVGYAGTTMSVSKGGRSVEVAVPSGWGEVVAFRKIVQLREDEVVVAPARKLAELDAAGALAAVEVEARRRGIRFDGGATSAEDGVFVVDLSLDGKETVNAVVGARSGDLMLFFAFLPGSSVPPVEEPAPVEEPTAQVGDAAQRLLDAHNAYRADHCAPALTWSDEIARVAQAWADQLKADGCSFEHSRSSYGENLAAGSAGSLTPEAVVAMWYDEIRDYDFGSGGFSMETGHLTQVLWKGSKRLGCGMATCNGFDLWVCNYDPPGNVEGGYPKNVLARGCK